MPKARLIVLMLACVLLAALLYAVFSNGHEPSYGGQPLSIWVVRLRDPAYAEDAPIAIRQMGKRAVPYLLRWLQQEPSHLPATIAKLAQHLPTGRIRLRALSWALVRQQDDIGQEVVRQTAVVAALTILGEEAAPAIPELTRALNQQALDSSAKRKINRAARALKAIGKEGLPPLVAATTNHPERQVTRLTALVYIGRMETNALPAVPTLLNLLNDQDPEVRQQAKHALLQIAPGALDAAR